MQRESNDILWIFNRILDKEEEEDKMFDFLECEKSLITSTTMNPFHIISLSEGFDLSSLFDEKKRGGDEICNSGGRFAKNESEEMEEMGFTFT